MKRNISGQDFLNYVHIYEFLSLLNGKIKPEAILKIIKKRKKYGYVLLNLRDKSYQNRIIDFGEDEFSPIEKIISDTHDEITKNKIKGKSIIGKPTITSDAIITGECVVINEEKELPKHNLNGKILVTVMTSPNFMPYLKDVKAIITDNGGVICHAAIISRELGIPCIMGTEIATNFFKTGDKVKMDMKAGSIEKI